MSHYDVEDEPTVNVENALAMYEQSKAVVAGGAELSDKLLGEAGPLLESLYNAASAAQNTELMVSVNSAWEKTQALAQIISQQSAAINGADVVIKLIEESRKATVEEYNKLITGLKETDSSIHPLLEQFRDQIEAETVEWLDFVDEYNDDFDTEAIVDHAYENVEPLLEDVTFIYRRKVVERLVDILMGEDSWDDAQEVLLRQLFKSLEPEMKRAPIESAEDYEEDEAAS